MNATPETINANSYAPDTSRPLHAVAPFRLIAGRQIIDANGRVVARGVRQEVMDPSGYTTHDDNAWSPAQTDDNANAICAVLNRAAIAHKLADALRQVMAKRGDYMGAGDSALVDYEDARHEGQDAARVALRAYVRAVQYAKRYVNPEEWETHIDWAKLERDATAVLGSDA